MCRLVAYKGDPILLSDVLIKPIDSIVRQSLLARESSIPTNGDGFGLGWYVPDISPDPAVFLSIFPAWNDENLLHLTAKIKSCLFFAHVRAASVGGVNNYNCHPFVYKNWLFMHNGGINDFSSIKRSLLHLLDDDLYYWVRGQTDSEHFFALFLQLAKGRRLEYLSEVTQLVLETFSKINQLLKAAGKSNASSYNLCMTDGKILLATRYCVDKSIEPESMHYLKGSYFWSKKDYLKRNKEPPQHCVLVASERLTNYNPSWHLVPANHFLLVNAHDEIELKPIVELN